MFDSNFFRGIAWSVLGMAVLLIVLGVVLTLLAQWIPAHVQFHMGIK